MEMNTAVLIQFVTRHTMYYNLPLSSVRVTIIVVEKQEGLYIVNVCVCSFSYPACRGETPFYIVI
jgi:hypothetical protein